VLEIGSGFDKLFSSAAEGKGRLNAIRKSLLTRA
jgi:hypothetical protein